MKITNSGNDDEGDNEIKLLTNTYTEFEDKKKDKSVVEILLEYKNYKEVANNLEDPDEGKTAEEMYLEDTE